MVITPAMLPGVTRVQSGGRTSETWRECGNCGIEHRLTGVCAGCGDLWLCLACLDDHNELVDAPEESDGQEGD